MSEMMEEHSISKFIGSPPGYVGYGEGGQLTELVRRAPYSVVLLDEIEKAHSSVTQLLLQVLEEGKLTDSLGVTVDFRNCIVIMSSNIGAEKLQKNSTVGFGVSADNVKDNILKEVKAFFAPEFINRLDEIIIFKPLSKENNKKIARLELKKLSERLKKQDVNIEDTPKVLDFLVEKGTSPKNGARFLKRVIQKNIEDKISTAILNKRKGSNQTLKITKKGGQLVVDEL